jgi:hypothetical protein
MLTLLFLHFEGDYMGEFRLPDVRFVPEIDVVGITLSNLKAQIEWINEYNLAARMGGLDPAGDPIPARYIGKNRYWMSEGEGRDNTVGSYPLFTLYDLDPRATDGKTLLITYKLVDPHGELVQTQKMAAKHIQAARLEAEREERMKKKDPKLNNTVSLHMPAIYRPAKAQTKALEALNESD